MVLDWQKFGEDCDDGRCRRCIPKKQKDKKILEMKWTDYGKAKFEIISVSCSSI